MVDTPPRDPGTKEYNSQRDIARWTRAVAIFTLALVLVSAAADLFIYQQYRVANEAQKDTREQLRAVISQRGGSVVVLHGPAPENRILGMIFVAHFYNTGGTRTAWFKGWISAHYFEGNEPPGNLDSTKPYNRVELSNTIIPANSPL